MRLAAAALLLMLLTLDACGKPKEAQDPSDVLAEDPAFMGGFDDKPLIDQKGSTVLDDELALDEQPEASPPATRADCETAHRHLEELGYDIEIQRQADPEKKRELRAARSAHLGSAATRHRIESGAQDCVAQSTTAAEARCIAGIRSQDEIDQCLP